MQSASPPVGVSVDKSIGLWQWGQRTSMGHSRRLVTTSSVAVIIAGRRDLRTMGDVRTSSWSLPSQPVRTA